MIDYRLNIFLSFFFHRTLTSAFSICLSAWIPICFELDCLRSAVLCQYWNPFPSSSAALTVWISCFRLVFLYFLFSELQWRVPGNTVMVVGNNSHGGRKWQQWLDTRQHLWECCKGSCGYHDQPGKIVPHPAVQQAALDWRHCGFVKDFDFSSSCTDHWYINLRRLDQAFEFQEDWIKHGDHRTFSKRSRA